MLISSKQLPIGRSQSWDTLGGNEGHWERSDSVYEQQARMAGRRNSLSYGADTGGGWYEPPPGVRPPDLDLKREPDSYQQSLYNQGYLDRPDPRNIRKSSVPELNSHYDRPSMANRGSLPHHDYYQQDPGMPPRPTDGFYRGEQPHSLNRSSSHYGIMAGPRQLWEQSSGGRPGSAAPTPGIPPPPPPSAHDMGRIYREQSLPGPPPATPGTKMMQDGQRIPSRAPSPARYIMEPNSSRYGAEPPASLTSHSVYSDVNGRPIDQPTATCLVVDPVAQGMDGTARAPPTALAPVTTPAPLPQLSAQPLTVAPPPTVPQTPVAPVDPKKNADPEFLALLQKEGLSESTITSLLQQGFDSTAMLAVMEENDVRSVAPNLGQARVLSRVVLGYKRPPEILPATPMHPSAPVRGRSNSFSHRSDIYVHQPPPLTPGLESQYMQPHSNPMQTISPRMGEGYSRRPSSAPSQQLLESSGYPGARSAGAYSGSVVPVQTRPLSGYNPHAGLHMPPMTAMSQHVAIPSHLPVIPSQMAIHAMPQPLPALPAVPQQMTMPALAPQQAPKAYTTNYTVPMELMKRDRSLATMSPMPSPHVSPQVMRRAGVASDGSLVPVGSAVPGQNVSLANQKLSRRTGPPVIVSTMASPDTSKSKPSSITFFTFSYLPLLHPL
ncbi:hypothetical protein DPX16_15361 [Anabarilius grahami]|uniref:Uncharacterized protein n=1 Tax=Anabarilius grahami TaxID=495550 RepID=A0A3N0XVU1_ANAGA|nr:hypothetical protein DPX16_15361 [Anabarilius grahami]